MVTYYVVQGFQHGKKGTLIADPPKQARNEDHCRQLAERLAKTCASVIAFSRSGEPEYGMWEDAIVISRYGEIPDELLEIAA